MTQGHIVSVGAIAPELELVQGLPDADHRSGAELGGPVVTLKEQRALGHVVLYFMRAFH